MKFYENKVQSQPKSNVQLIPRFVMRLYIKEDHAKGNINNKCDGCKNVLIKVEKLRTKRDVSSKESMDVTYHVVVSQMS